MYPLPIQIPFHEGLVGKGTTLEILLYGLIEVFSFQDDYTITSANELASRIGSTPQLVADALTHMAEMKWLKIKKTETLGQYDITPILNFHLVLPKEEEGGKND